MRSGSPCECSLTKAATSGSGKGAEDEEVEEEDFLPRDGEAVGAALLPEARGAARPRIWRASSGSPKRTVQAALSTVTEEEEEEEDESPATPSMEARSLQM